MPLQKIEFKHKIQWKTLPPHSALSCIFDPSSLQCEGTDQKYKCQNLPVSTKIIYYLADLPLNSLRSSSSESDKIVIPSLQSGHFYYSSAPMSLALLWLASTKLVGYSTDVSYNRYTITYPFFLHHLKSRNWSKHKCMKACINNSTFMWK